MLPIDSVTIPLKTAQFQQEMALQRVQALINRKKAGTLQPDDVEKVRTQILKEYEQRKKSYETLDKIFKAVDNFQPQQDTKILSKNGNTPLHYDPQITQINQSDEMNEMLRAVCLAEYAARNYDDPDLLRRVEQDTGLNYSACYAPLHEALRSEKLSFLAKSLFSDDTDKLSHFNTLDLPNQKKFIKQEYVAKFSSTPGFPEHLLAKGFQVFATQFCDGSSNTIQFDTLTATCPCCMHPQTYTPPDARELKTVLRCVHDDVLINIDDDKIFFVPNRGFMCEQHGAKEQGARRVVLCW
ncbi:Conserved_hypothetical protein [Hexamita inflata]|uniref:Uncharacterized protein n=1 Tax=Hexamita inflata TaxID=28002 RepID=A0ABP1GJE9_9EUKA